MSRQARHALDTDEHHAGRVIRGVEWVVWVETAEAKWIELDAHSVINAETLAKKWIRPELGARGASVRGVRKPSGLTTFRKLFTPPQPYFDDEEVGVMSNCIARLREQVTSERAQGPSSGRWATSLLRSRAACGANVRGGKEGRHDRRNGLRGSLLVALDVRQLLH